MKDFMGNLIEVGSVIVYPVRSGSHMWLQKGTVRAIEQVNARRAPVVLLKVETTERYKWGEEAKKTRMVTVSHLLRVVVVGKAEPVA